MKLYAFVKNFRAWVCINIYKFINIYNYMIKFVHAYLYILLSFVKLHFNIIKIYNKIGNKTMLNTLL